MAAHPVGPTEISLDFIGLERCATRMAVAAHHGGRAAVAASSSRVSPGAFGLLCAPLGAVAASFTSQAGDLIAALDQASTAVQDGARTVHDQWRRVEEEAAESGAALARALEEGEQ